MRQPVVYQVKWGNVQLVCVCLAECIKSWTTKEAQFFTLAVRSIKRNVEPWHEYKNRESNPPPKTEREHQRHAH